MNKEVKEEKSQLLKLKNEMGKNNVLGIPGFALLEWKEEGVSKGRMATFKPFTPRIIPVRENLPPSGMVKLGLNLFG